jgi:hypothetical protein
VISLCAVCVLEIRVDFHESMFVLQVEATLLVNIKGCGYPPEVQCSHFWELYAREGAKFPCHYSRRNASLVLPRYVLVLFYFCDPQ